MVFFKPRCPRKTAREPHAPPRFRFSVSGLHKSPDSGTRCFVGKSDFHLLPLWWRVYVTSHLPAVLRVFRLLLQPCSVGSCMSFVFVSWRSARGKAIDEFRSEVLSDCAWGARVAHLGDSGVRFRVLLRLQLFLFILFCFLYPFGLSLCFVLLFLFFSWTTLVGFVPCSSCLYFLYSGFCFCWA